jgi:hypothetical protein
VGEAQSTPPQHIYAICEKIAYRTGSNSNCIIAILVWSRSCTKCQELLFQRYRESRKMLMQEYSVSNKELFLELKKKESKKDKHFLNKEDDKILKRKIKKLLQCKEMNATFAPICWKEKPAFQIISKNIIIKYFEFVI